MPCSAAAADPGTTTACERIWMGRTGVRMGRAGDRKAGDTMLVASISRSIVTVAADQSRSRCMPWQGFAECPFDLADLVVDLRSVDLLSVRIT
jgi:hypothetical protein